jgi:hypothetical protein
VVELITKNDDEFHASMDAAASRTGGRMGGGDRRVAKESPIR